MNIGVIGAGIMGSNHIRVISAMKDVNLTAVCDVDLEKLKEMTQKVNVRWLYKDYKEMLSKERLDGVIVAVPSAFHKKVVLDCIEAGVNVLVEKPISDNLKDAQEMIDQAKKKKIIFTVGHIERFNPVVMKIKEFIEKNMLGKIYLVNTIRVGPFPKRFYGTPGGVLVDLAVHDVDIINYLVGNINQVYSQLIVSGKQEIYAKSLFQIDNDIRGSSEFSWVSPKKVRIIEVYGTRGMLRGDYQNQELKFFENSDESEGALAKGKISEGMIIEYPIQKQEPLKLELDHFIDCIKNKKQPLVKPEDAIKSLKIALAILESGENNKTVRI